MPDCISTFGGLIAPRDRTTLKSGTDAKNLATKSDLDADRPLSLPGQPRDHCLSEDRKVGPVHVGEGIILVKKCYILGRSTPDL